MAALAPPPVRATAAVSLGAVERNCARLAGELREGTALCAVVKADGYGHGAAECAGAALAGGASWLAVVTATEAWDLRQRFPEVPILVMGPLTPAEVEVALQARADLGVWDAGFLDALERRAGELWTVARVHIKHDSGMGRLGERDPEAVAALVRRAADAGAVEPVGLWTHLATADEPDSDFVDEQLGRFRALAEPLRAQHPGLILHAANSAATLREPSSHLDMVRCGIAIYGLDPFHADPGARGLEPALELRSWVASVKRFEPGASAGYGRRWRAPSETMVGLVPLGYGDGVRRGLSDNAEVLVGGRRHPLVGTVSMDSVTIDLGPETEVEPGAEAVLIGSQGDERITAEEVAQRLGTINYEVTCGISSRVPRTHGR